MLLKNMTIKVVTEVKTGVSATTGNPWKGMNVVLALPDGEFEARFYASLRGEMVDRFAEMGLKVGDRVDVELAFLTESYRGYISNKVYVKGLRYAACGNETSAACGNETSQGDYETPAATKRPAAYENGTVPVPRINPNFPNY